jgi:hypothetical protein
VIHAIALAHFSLTLARSVAANSINARIRLGGPSHPTKQDQFGPTSGVPELSACTRVTTSETYWIDIEPVTAGACHNYLVRALTPYAGGWGADSLGLERTGICP